MTHTDEAEAPAATKPRRRRVPVRKPLSVGFSAKEREWLQGRADEEGMTEGMVVREAVRWYRAFLLGLVEPPQQ